MTPETKTALVAFTDRTGLKWLRVLKPGFRHCLAFLPLGDGWVAYNPMSHWTELTPAGAWHAPDLAAWLGRNGFTVVETHFKPPSMTVAPWRPYTCVEAVKRVLGLKARWVTTPWQLFLHLRREGGIVTPLWNGDGLPSDESPLPHNRERS